MLKRLFSLILVAITVFSFIACQASPSGGTDVLNIGEGIKLYLDDALFEEGTAVSAELLYSGGGEQSIFQIEAYQLTAVKISALKDGVEIEPTGTFTVEFPIPDGYSDKLALYYAPENGDLEKLSSTVDEKKNVITVKLDRLGTYVLADLGIPSGTSHTHDYAELKYDSDSHWLECSCSERGEPEAHGYGEWTVTAEPTESTDGSRYRVCSVCEYKETEVIPSTSHTHLFDEWKSDADSHWQECTCTKKENESSHTYGSWTVTKEATTSSEGSKYRACTVCGYKQTEVIPVVHTHSFDTQKYNSESHWNECSCAQKQDKASHTYGSWTVTKEATTSSEGSRYRACTVCGYKQTEVIPVLAHSHTFKKTSAGLETGKCDVCGKPLPIYNLGGEIYDRPGENLWLVVNESGSYDWYYGANVNDTFNDYCNAEFANNYSSYRYPIMEVKVSDGEEDHRYVLIFYIEDGELKHIIPSDPSWNGVIPDNVVDPKEIFCSDGSLRDTYEETVWSGYVIANGVTTLGGKTEEYTVTLSMHTPRSKSFWETNRSGPTFFTYYTTSYSAPFRKLDNDSSELKNTVHYNASGDYYTVSAYTEKYYQAPDVYDLYYYQNDGLLKMLTSGYSPMYYLYSDMTCEKINSTSAPLSKEIYQGSPYGLEFTLMSDDPNEVVTYKFVVDHPEFRNITEAYKTVHTKHEIFLVKDKSSAQPYFKYKMTGSKPA